MSETMTITQATGPSQSLWETLKEDLACVFQRDPAARSTIEVISTYPGLHAILLHRLAHRMWLARWRYPARFLSFLGRMFTNVDIHPGAEIGRRFFIDHGACVVIGETAEVGDDVTLYHGVTLGGTSWNKGKRHPTLGSGVVVGAGAKILGPIEIGERVRVGANSVVVKDVPANSVVVGVPGRVRSHEPVQEEESEKHEDLQHNQLHDVTMERLQALAQRVARMEAELVQVEGGLADEEAMVANGYQGPWGI